MCDENIYGYWEEITWQEEERSGVLLTYRDKRFRVTDKRIKKMLDDLDYMPSYCVDSWFYNTCGEEIRKAYREIDKLVKEAALFNEIEAIYQKAYKTLTSTFYVVEYMYKCFIDDFPVEGESGYPITDYKAYTKDGKPIKSKEEAFQILENIKKEQIEWSNPIIGCRVIKVSFVPTESQEILYKEDYKL